MITVAVLLFLAIVLMVRVAYLLGRGRGYHDGFEEGRQLSTVARVFAEDDAS